MFLSIPYEKGWRIYVDGKKTETVCLLNAMLGARISAGEHDIRIEYVPEGFPAGLVLSTSSAALIGVTIWFEKKRKKKKAAVSSDEERPLFSDEPDYTEINKSEIYNQEIEETDAKSEHEDISAQELEAENEKSESNDSLQGD